MRRRPRQMEGDGAGAVQRRRRLESQVWAVGDTCRLNWPGIKSTLRCTVVAIDYWMEGSRSEIQMPTIEFPTPQMINRRLEIRIRVTSDAIVPYEENE